MTLSRRLRYVRRGFTLVELMVATALVVLILTILAVAFGAATDSLSRLRSTGNMATDLRGTQDKLRADLEAQHFETGDSPGTLRLSDLKYHLLPGDTSVRTPLGGYFRIENGNGSRYEGLDADTLSSSRADGTSAHAVEFTTKRQGTSPDDLYVIGAPSSPALVTQNTTDTPLTGGQFVSKWARVRWFLANQQTAAGNVPVWTLYRRVRLVAPQAGAAVAGDEVELVSLNAANQTVTLDQLTTFANRNLMNTPLAGANTRGDDIVLSNVTSFEVKPTWEAPAAANPTPRAPRAFWPIANNAFGTTILDGTPGVPPTAATPTTANGDFPFDDLPGNPAITGPRVFDTGNDVATLPLRIRVTALQVKIRVFDPKTLLSRQVSFIVQP